MAAVTPQLPLRHVLWPLLTSALLAACSTPVSLTPVPAPVSAPAPVTGAPSASTPSTPAVPVPVEPAPAQPVAVPEPAAPYSAAVAARFPDPAVRYATPAFQAGRDTFTTNDELRVWLRDLARPPQGVSPGVHVLNLGRSQAGSPIQAVLVSHDTDVSPAALRRSPRPTVFLVGQQHGDEPAASEALMVVARALAQGDLQGVLDRVHVIVLPRANPDGAVAGTRGSSSGIDINRDHLLLRTPEAQAIAKVMSDYRPAVVVDAHEYTVVGRFLQKFSAIQKFDALTQYATTANMAPFLTRAAEEWFRQPMLSKLRAERLSVDWYYTTSADLNDHKVSMGGVQPDTGRNVNGLKNAISILVETRGVGIGRLHLARRVHTHVVAASSILHSAAERAEDLLKLRQYVDSDVSAKACQGQIVVEAAATPSEYALQMLDPTTGADRTVQVNWDTALALREVKIRPRPCGYWLAADQHEVVTKLRALGVRVDQFSAAGVVQGETFREVSRQSVQRPDVRGTVADGGEVLKLEVGRMSTLVDTPPGSYYVPLGQPLAHLVTAALEPDTASSYAAHRIVTDVSRVSRVMAVPSAAMRPLP